MRQLVMTWHGMTWHIRLLGVDKTQLQLQSTRVGIKI